jgi:hypothetical protein
MSRPDDGELLTMLKMMHSMNLHVPVFAIVFSSLAQAGPIDDLQPGHWYEVPNSHLSDVGPPGWAPYDGVIRSWSGGAFDTNRGRLIVWGGGHRAYGGNEIYVFDVNTLQWTRLNDPSPNPLDNVTYQPDGNPSTRHTYQYIEHIPSVDRFYTFGGAGHYGDGNYGTWNVDRFNFDTGAWETQRAVLPSVGASIGHAAYDPVEGVVYYRASANAQLIRYDPATDTYTSHGPLQPIPYYGILAVDPKRRILVIIGQGYQAKWDLNNIDAGYSSFSTSGPTTLINSGLLGVVYDDVTDKFVGWTGGTTVYTLDMDTLTWTQVAAAPTNSVNPGGPASTGTYGRWRYVPSKNAFIVVNSVNLNVYFYKLSAALGGPRPTPPIALQVQ